MYMLIVTFMDYGKLNSGDGPDVTVMCTLACDMAYNMRKGTTVKLSCLLSYPTIIQKLSLFYVKISIVKNINIMECFKGRIIVL